MTNYLIRRAITMVIVLFLSSVAVFAILNAAPGGPLDGLRMQNADRNRRVTALDYARLENLLGLDKPVHLRYIVWLAGDDWIEVLPVWFTGTNAFGEPFKNGTHKGILRGDWGESWRVAQGRPVLDVIKSRLGNTVILMSSATILSLLVAVPIGVLSAVKQYSTLDYVATTFSFIGISMPVFWLGLMMIILFSLKFKQWGLPYLPSGGIVSLRGPGAGTLWDRIKHLIMPTTVLSLLYMAGWSRFMRTAMLDVLHQDYIRTARAKGLVERVVISKHAFRNALIPLITIVTLQLSSLFGGAVLTETVFAYTGMGRLYFEALGQSDWPLVMGYLLISAVLVVVSNLIADIAYVLVDPRIRYD
ncbi:MAG TPA: ABC transporter permease [Chloroflexi bacterium]|nr:ABC transporter permease [Chloroflexota bacterium]